MDYVGIREMTRLIVKSITWAIVNLFTTDGPMEFFFFRFGFRYLEAIWLIAHETTSEREISLAMRMN